MADHQRAVVVPYSSIVGSSVTLHDPSGVVIGQLAILNTSSGDDTPEERKAKQIAVATEVAKAINMHKPMAHMLEVIRDNVMDEITDTGVEHLPKQHLQIVRRLVDQAKE